MFFLTKTVKIRWNWRCKIFSLKIRRCKFFDKFHVCPTSASENSSDGTNTIPCGLWNLRAWLPGNLKITQLTLCVWDVIASESRKMCVMMLWSSVAVNVGGWRRVAGMEVLATFTSRDPRSGWCTNYVQRIVRISPSFCVTWQINVKVGDGDGVQLDLFILNSMAVHIYKNKSKILPTILSQKVIHF